MRQLLAYLFRFGILLSLFVLVFESSSALAEPWLSNRHAQNCAGCHAPGRMNKPAKKRRCSLSCQGCHVNPNGGGLRSHYGKWNEEHWVRSFASSKLKNKRMFLPFDKQRTKTIRDSYRSKKISSASKKSKKSKKSKRLLGVQSQYGVRLMPGKNFPVDESDYDRRDGGEYYTASSEVEWLSTVTKNDPYRVMNREKLDGGMDIRFQYFNASGTIENDGEQVQDFSNGDFFPMVADLALRYRPLNTRYHLVVEQRFIGFPGRKNRDFVSGTSTRSMYALVDDLPYNTFVMGGIYKPLIGNNNADHTLLSEEIKTAVLQSNGGNKSYGLGYEAITIGGAPNVPFANLHILGRQYNSGSVSNEEQWGIGMNLGFRAIKFSLSGKYSFFMINGTQENLSENTETAMLHVINGGAMLGRYIANLEMTYFTKIFNGEAISGLSVNSEHYIKVWREMYATANINWANTTADLYQGNATQLRVGVKTFLYPGVHFLAGFNVDVSERTSDQTPLSMVTKANSIIAQLHFYM